MKEIEWGSISKPGCQNMEAMVKIGQFRLDDTSYVYLYYDTMDNCFWRCSHKIGYDESWYVSDTVRHT